MFTILMLDGNNQIRKTEKMRKSGCIGMVGFGIILLSSYLLDFADFPQVPIFIKIRAVYF